VWGWIPQRLVEPCELGAFRLFAVGLFESGRVSGGGGDRGQVLRLHPLSRAQRLSDPTVGSNGLPNWFGVDQQAPAYKAAYQACQKDSLSSLAPHASAAKATANASALKYAVCMRSNGVPDFPDPNGQGVIQINNATGVLEPSSPAFQKAQRACKSLENGFGVQSSTATGGASASGGAASGS
jgi:hypothetical protein